MVCSEGRKGRKTRSKTLWKKTLQILFARYHVTKLNIKENVRITSYLNS